jgi:cytoplasmic tRNA 2-thiolation protein 1
VCKACILLEGLNSGLPTLGVGRTRGNQGNKNRGRRGNNAAAAGAQQTAAGGLIQLKLEEEKEAPAAAAGAATPVECSSVGS